jgi:hypothetical protein
MNAVLAWLLDRAKEPSTWAGTGIIAVAVHSAFPGSVGDAILQVGSAAAGLLAVVVAEKKAA